MVDTGAGTSLERWVIRQGKNVEERTGPSIKLPIDRNTRIEAVFGPVSA